MNTELQHVRSDHIVKLSAKIAIQAHRSLHACELHAEKAVNSNRVKRCCLIGCDQESVESCNTHYFQGRHRVKNSFQSGKVHISQSLLSWGGDYAKVKYEGFYIIWIILVKKRSKLTFTLTKRLKTGTRSFGAAGVFNTELQADLKWLKLIFSAARMGTVKNNLLSKYLLCVDVSKID